MPKLTLPKRPRALGLYLHIPFCARKCPYCDFYSVTDLSQLNRYLAALTRQMAEYAITAQSYLVDTIFFGGGTPSLLSGWQWDKLFRAIGRCFQLAENVEVTVEVNPDSAGLKLFGKLRKLGVNRLSIGAQSFDNRTLERIGRLHNTDQIRKAVSDARAAGFDNISLDLMFGLPGQTQAQWADTLRQAVALGVPHLSAYGLRVEEDTPFGRQVDLLQLPDDDFWAEEYLQTVELMHQFGYLQYEVSNFCLPGYASRHNLKYWTMAEYLGLGPSAHSYFGNRRFGFAKDLDRYCNAIEMGDDGIVVDLFEVAPKDALSDTVMLALRLTRGIDLEELSRLFHRESIRQMGQKLPKYVDAGYMVQQGTRYRLTPRGFCISNSILADLTDFGCDTDGPAANAPPFSKL